MPSNQFVVLDSSGQTDVYLTSYSNGNPPTYMFGTLENAISYATLEAANTVAATIGGGTTGIPKPKKP